MNYLIKIIFKQKIHFNSVDVNIKLYFILFKKIPNNIL